MRGKKNNSIVAGRRTMRLRRTRGMSELIVNGHCVRGTVDVDGTPIWSVADFVGALYKREDSTSVSKIGSVYTQRFRRDGAIQNNVLKEFSILTRMPGARGALTLAMSAQGLSTLITTMRFKKSNVKMAKRAHDAYTALMALQ